MSSRLFRVAQLLSCLLVLMCSCEGAEGGLDEDGGVLMKMECGTTAVTEVDLTTATLNGEVRILNYRQNSNIEVSFYYSASLNDKKTLISSGNRVSAGTISADYGQFSASLSGLNPGTQYYYIAAVKYGKDEATGEMMSFSTKEKPKELSVTGSATDVTENSVKLSGYANLTPDLGQVTIGFIISLEKNPSIDNGIEIIVTELDGNNMYISSVSDLASDTKYYYKAFVKYGGVYRSGEIMSFQTKQISATVSTRKATNVGLFSGTLSGALSTVCQGLPIEVGFVYSDKATSLEELQIYGKRVTSSLGEDGSFSVSFTELIEGQTYYYVAYGVVYDKTFYGNISSFSTSTVLASVATHNVDGVGLFETTLNGHLSVENPESVQKSVWFLYCNDAHDIDYLLIYGTKVPSSIDNNGDFKAQIHSLEAGCTYSYVACAKVHNNTFYGEVNDFTTSDYSASVLTFDAYNIDLFSATISGNLTVNAEEELSKSVWFIFDDKAETMEGLIENGKKYQSEVSSNGRFECKLNGLEPGKVYYYLACSKVHTRKYYGEMKSFTTKDYYGEVSSLPATNVEMFTGTLEGKLISENDESLSKSVWFVYSSNETQLDALLARGKMIAASLNDDHSFSASLSSLANSTTYYYVACARIHEREYYGKVNSFSTKGVSAHVSSLSASDIGLYKATLNGSLAISNKESLSKSVWFLYSTTVSTLEGLKTNGIDISGNAIEDGSFAANLSKLSVDSKYYYVACAKVHDTILYGDVCSFSTKSIPAGAIDLGLSVAWATTNIGATSIEEGGDRYAWGEIETKTVYSSSNYKWSDGSSLNLTKYNCDSNYGVVDNKRALDLEDDVAHAKLGGDWRMPLYIEAKELMDNCSWKMYEVGGTSGVLGTSKINGNTIFFPDSEYWTASTWSGQYRAMYYTTKVFFNINTDFRYNGYRVRGVIE